MLARLGFASLDELSDATLPEAIRLEKPLKLSGLDGAGRGEFELLGQLRAIASQNRVMRSCIGMGYSDVIVPPVIQRNVLENPGWYTQYTPYQAEIAQGRLEALLNFQTMIADLTGLPLANASLLDEGTSAAEAMAMCSAIARGRKAGFFASRDCHPQTLGVLRTRAVAAGVTLHVGDVSQIDFDAQGLCGVLLQYPTSDGRIESYRELSDRAHTAGACVVVAADLMALTLLEPPGEFGADIAVGSAQRLGVPLGFGGPHAGYLSTTDAHSRKIPGRIVGVSKDVHGKLAYRLAIQTREQHIRRDKATSNICTAQVLLAIMASMYGVYHGPDGLRRIAGRIHSLARALAAGLRDAGCTLGDAPFFDTLRVTPPDAAAALAAARACGFNLRDFGDGTLGISLDETSTPDDVALLIEALGGARAPREQLTAWAESEADAIPDAQLRRSEFLTHPVFHAHRTEHEMLRYIHRLQSRDLSLTTSMIPLGSCTMKLNATSEMLPVTWPEFGGLHPFAPEDQSAGYARVIHDLENWLAEITQLPAVSLQPNAGSQGEFAGLLAIRRYHDARGDTQRDVCLIPVSAHGTNAASAVTAGFRCIAVACNARGDVDLEDLRARAAEHSNVLGALMLTYPSTHGVFEEAVREVCEIVHEHGGQVYLDGANLNAQVGLTAPGTIGADVCHMNLHKTFCIPHGGGGPGMGPISAAEHLRPYLPGHPIGGDGAVSAAPFGSPSILPISWVYIALMGAGGLKRATQVAILNANYMAERLSAHFDVLYRGPGGRVAHEFIIDCRPFEKLAGIGVEDIAKRLMDFGFHAPTMSFPVAGTLMIEPTESESKAELDRLCEALITIHGEIGAIESGELDRDDNPLKGAPHTAEELCADEWSHAYSRDRAAYPLSWVREHKFWPVVGRIDNPYGDRNLMCTCPPLEALTED
jgi:glycine dehydrogenase